MGKKPINLTLDEGVLEFAERIMAVRRFGKLTPLIEQLIREEYERRHGPLTMHDAPLSSDPSLAAGKIVDAAAAALGATTALHPPATPTTYSTPARTSRKRRRAGAP